MLEFLSIERPKMIARHVGFLSLLLVSSVWSRPQSESSANTVQLNSIVEELPAGKFDYSFQTSNQIETWASGRITNPQEPRSENQIQQIEGCYTYLDPAGQRHTVIYTADERGYLPVVSNLTSCPQSNGGSVGTGSLRIINGDNCGRLEENPTDIRQRAPWVASIFQKQADGSYLFLCGATITSPTVVVTSANCVQEITKRGSSSSPDERRHLKYDSLRLVVGLRGANYDDRDSFTQEVSIIQLLEHKGQGKENGSPKDVNLAGIRLGEALKFNSYVFAACVVELTASIQQTLSLIGNNSIILAGYSREIRSLEIRTLRTLDKKDCRSKYKGRNLNVVCAQDFNLNRNEQRSIPCDLEGYGMVAQANNRGLYYIVGVYSSNTARIEQRNPYPVLLRNPDVKCGLDDVIFFTAYAEVYPKGFSAQDCNVNSLQCRNDKCRPLNELCDGTANCEDGSDELATVCAAQK